MVESHVFIFLGSDELQKQKKIETLQKNIFPPSLKDLNYTVFYGDDKQLRPQDLKEALVCFPTGGAKKRLLLIRMAHKLNRANQACLLKELQEQQNKNVVILDVPQVQDTQEFVDAFIKIGAEVIRFKSEVSTNIFDLGRSIISREPQAALKILSRLLTDREKAEKILGVIFWQWEHSYSRKRITEEAYKKGVKLILEADKRLKSSSSAYARSTLILEALVVKLAYLR